MEDRVSHDIFWNNAVEERFIIQDFLAQYRILKKWLACF